MPITGDYAMLGRIAAEVDGLSDVPKLASTLAADRIAALIQLEFDAAVNPYGEAWTSLAPATIAKGRHAPPLTDTRELRDSLRIDALSSGGLSARIGTIDHPAGPHQDGWSGKQGSGPARPIFPTTDMPESWSSAIEDSVGDSVLAALRSLR